MISIKYFAPAPPLRPYLSSYYWVEANQPTFSDLMRAELPQIRLITRGSASNTYVTGVSHAAPAISLQGPTTGPVHFIGTGPLNVFGVGLMPQGWAALIGDDASRHSDSIVDLAAVLGAPATDVLCAMACAANDAERVAAADRFFLGLLECAHATPLWFTRLTDNWLVETLNPDVDTLVSASGMSARSVERLSQRIYGASPKLMARKYRALNAAVQIGNREVDGWSDLTPGAFFDQAHFIREFKQFMGLTPSRFLVESATISRITIARKKLLPGLPRLAFYS